MVSTSFISREQQSPEEFLTIFDKIYRLCKIAELDPASLYHRECFSIDWKNNKASILYQLYNGIMNAVYVTGKSEDTQIESPWLALCGYSFHDDILFSPRRVYVSQHARRNMIVSTHIMPILEQMALARGTKFILTSFNDNARGIRDFNVYKTRKLLKYKTGGKFMYDFIPVSDKPITIMNMPQWAIYKKLTADSLTVEHAEQNLQYKS
jgi:hypothetical protein